MEVEMRKRMWFKTFFLGVLVVLGMSWLIRPVPARGGAAEEVEKQFIQVVKEVMPSVVSIHYFLRKKYMPRQARMGRDFLAGDGSGFIFLPKGYIMTNAHVLFENYREKQIIKERGPENYLEKITVTLNDGRELPARFILANVDQDLAVVKIEGKDFPAAHLGDSDQLTVGQWAIAIGNPLSLSETVTVGVISAVNRPMKRRGKVLTFIQTCAPTTYGNSGGPLIDIHGRVIGINSMVSTMKKRLGSDFQGRPITIALQAPGLSFAIPIRRALDIVRPYMK